MAVPNASGNDPLDDFLSKIFTRTADLIRGRHVVASALTAIIAETKDPKQRTLDSWLKGTAGKKVAKENATARRENDSLPLGSSGQETCSANEVICSPAITTTETMSSSVTNEGLDILSINSSSVTPRDSPEIDCGKSDPVLCCEESKERIFDEDSSLSNVGANNNALLPEKLTFLKCNQITTDELQHSEDVYDKAIITSSDDVILSTDISSIPTGTVDEVLDDVQDSTCRNRCSENVENSKSSFDALKADVLCDQAVFNSTRTSIRDASTTETAPVVQCQSPSFESHKSETDKLSAQNISKSSSGTIAKRSRKPKIKKRSLKKGSCDVNSLEKSPVHDSAMCPGKPALSESACSGECIASDREAKNKLSKGKKMLHGLLVDTGSESNLISTNDVSVQDMRAITIRAAIPEGDSKNSASVTEECKLQKKSFHHSVKSQKALNTSSSPVSAKQKQRICSESGENSQLSKAEACSMAKTDVELLPKSLKEKNRTPRKPEKMLVSCQQIAVSEKDLKKCSVQVSDIAKSGSPEFRSLFTRNPKLSVKLSDGCTQLSTSKRCGKEESIKEKKATGTVSSEEIEQEASRKQELENVRGGSGCSESDAICLPIDSGLSQPDFLLYNELLEEAPSLQHSIRATPVLKRLRKRKGIKKVEMATPESNDTSTEAEQKSTDGNRAEVHDSSDSVEIPENKELCSPAHVFPLDLDAVLKKEEKHRSRKSSKSRLPTSRQFRGRKIRKPKTVLQPNKFCSADDKDNDNCSGFQTSKVVSPNSSRTELTSPSAKPLRGRKSSSTFQTDSSGASPTSETEQNKSEVTVDSTVHQIAPHSSKIDSDYDKTAERPKLSPISITADKRETSTSPHYNRRGRSATNSVDICNKPKSPQDTSLKILRPGAKNVQDELKNVLESSDVQQVIKDAKEKGHKPCWVFVKRHVSEDGTVVGPSLYLVKSDLQHASSK